MSALSEPKCRKGSNYKYDLLQRKPEHSIAAELKSTAQ